MAVSDADQERITDLLLRDIAATVGFGHELTVEAIAARARAFGEDLDRYTERVAEDVQQYLHDGFIDTTWPRCPRHAHHPMWFHDGAWHADGQRAAGLGELGWLYTTPGSHSPVGGGEQ